MPTNIGKNRRDEGVYSHYLTHHVGNAVRSHLKLQVRKFKDLKDEDFTDADAFIQDKFDIDLAKQEHIDCIRGTMMDLYRKYRSQLYFWYKKHGSFPQGKLTPYPRVSLEDWEYLCEHVFIDEVFKNQSKKNEVNITKKKVWHTTGQMSFQRIFAATKETSRINQFKLTHYYDKKGWCAGAKEKYDEMFNAKERPSQSGEVDEERIVADVLGYRSGYIKGQGTAQQHIPRGPRGISSSQQVEAMVTGIREECV